jgi:hypothetical protein
MGTNYIAPMWRMPRNANKDKLSNYSINIGAAGEYIDANTSLDTSYTSLTLSAWVKYDSLVDYEGTLFGQWIANAFSSSTLLAYVEPSGVNKLFKVYWGPTTSNPLIYTTALQTDVWYHIVITWDGNNIKLFINGTEEDSQVKTSINNSTQTLKIGAYINASQTAYVGELNGQVSQACLFDYALDSTQINYLYNLNNPMVISGGEPVAYWPLGDNSNPTANAGYPNISVGADSVFEFDRGSSESIDVNMDLSSFSSITVSTWAKFNSATDYQYVYSAGTGSVAGDMLGIGKWDGTTEIYSFDRVNANRTGVSVTLNTWNHILVTHTGTTRKVYLNGSLIGTFTSGNLNLNSINFIGRYSFAALYYMDGSISNIQIWDTPLSGPEVETLYNNGQPLMSGTQPQATNLKAWYKLNQSSNWEADSVGNWQIPDARSAFPQSFKFIQANNDAIDTGSINLGTENSISFWFNFNDAGTTQTIIGSSGTSYYIIQFGGNYIAIRPDGGSDVFYSPYFTLIRPPYKTQGVWGHYLITRNGNTIRLFINGDEKAVSGTGTGMGSTIINRIGTSGGASGGAYANGEISNVAFWNSDQSSEKDNIYNDGTPATSYTNTPQYWYKLDNTSVWNPAPANYWTFPNAGEQDNSGIFNFSN